MTTNTLQKLFCKQIPVQQSNNIFKIKCLKNIVYLLLLPPEWTRIEPVTVTYTEEV